MRSSRPDSEQKQNSLFLENRELKSYLSNRKQLDFALKLALGSQAYLHDISSINDDSNASFSSIGNQMSPIKPVEKSQYKAKQSRFKEKENIKENHNMKSIEKSILSNTSQQRNMRQRLHSLQLWISFVKQRMKFSGQPQITNKVSSSVNGGSLTEQQVNTFFKDVIYRLEKLQVIEKEEYNCKFMLCQLTQASIRENQYENKIEMLEKQIREKNIEITQLKEIIENLGRSKSRKGSGSPNRYGTQSLLAYSITDEESKMQYDDRTLKMSMGTASPSQKKRLFESVNLIQKQIEETGEKMTTNAKTIQSNEKNSSIIKCKLFPQTNKKEQDQQFLLNQLSIKEAINQNPVVINKKEKLSHYEASNSQDQIQQQKDDSSYKISESEIIEIRNEMEKLIAEKDELMEKLKTMSAEIAQFKANQDKESGYGDNKESMLYQMLSDGHQQVEDQQFTEKQNEQEQPYQSRFNHTAQHQFMAKDNQAIPKKLSLFSNTVFLNQNLESPCIAKSCMSCPQLQSQIKSLQNHMALIIQENQSLRQQLEQLQKYYQESQHQKLKLMQQICQIEAKSQQNETKVSNFINEENLNNALESNTNDKIDNVKQDQVQESQSNLLSFCEATDQPNNNDQQVNNENTSAPQQSLKSLFSSLPQQLKQIFITLLQTNERLRLKLKAKISELNKIKFILKQAKQINDQDMNSLQRAIQNGNQKRSRQIQKLKQMERQWRISNEQNKKKQLTSIQQKNKELKLKVNNRMFKFIKHDKRKNSLNKRNSIQAI